MNSRFVGLAAITAIAVSACVPIDRPNKSAGIVRSPATNETIFVSGTLDARQIGDLPPGSMAEVTVSDISLADAPATVLARQTIAMAGLAHPVPFSLEVVRNHLDSRSTYAVRATIRDAEGALLWTTDTVNRVDQQADRNDMGSLHMVPAGTKSALVHPIEATFQCGTSRAEAVFDGDALALTVEDKHYQLTQAIAASGARYVGQSPDGDVTFWNKGQRATLTVGSQTYSECAVIPGHHTASALEGEEWVVEDIGSRGIIDSSRVTLQFSDGKITGRGGCNRYSASYQIDGKAMQVGDAVSTRMACAPALMNQEAAFHAILAKTSQFEFGANGTLILVAKDGRAITALR